MVSVDRMLIYILSVSVKALEMFCAVAAESLGPGVWDLKPDDLHLCNLRNPDFSCIQFRTSVTSFGACPDCDCISLL